MKQLKGLLIFILLFFNLVTSAQAASASISSGVLTINQAQFNQVESYTSGEGWYWRSSGHAAYGSLSGGTCYSCRGQHYYSAPGSVYWGEISSYQKTTRGVAKVGNSSYSITNGVVYGVTNGTSGGYNYDSASGTSAASCNCCRACGASEPYASSLRLNAGSRGYRYTNFNTRQPKTVLKNCMTTGETANLSSYQVIIDGGTYSGSPASLSRDTEEKI